MENEQKEDSAKEKNKLKENMEVRMHRIMCVSGGFMAGYAIFGRMGSLASAQTVNLIEIVINLIGRNFSDVAIRFMAVFLYILGMVIGSFIKYKFGEVKLRLYTLSVLVVGYLGISLIPEKTNLFVSLLPIFFMASTQWFAFSGTKKYNCSTIFSSSNFKQASVGYINYLIYKKEEFRENGKFYILSLLSYHIGVAIAVILSIEFGVRSAIFGAMVAAPVIKIIRKAEYGRSIA